MIICNCTCDISQFLHGLEQIWQKLHKSGITTTSTFLSINFLYGTFVLILYCTPICLVESSCLTNSPSSSSDLRTLSILLFSFCLTVPSTSIILVRGPLVYTLISGNIRQPKMEPSLSQYTQNWVCYVVYCATGSSRNNPIADAEQVSPLSLKRCVSGLDLGTLNCAH